MRCRGLEHGGSVMQLAHDLHCTSRNLINCFILNSNYSLEQFSMLRQFSMCAGNTSVAALAQLRQTQMQIFIKSNSHTTDERQVKESLDPAKTLCRLELLEVHECLHKCHDRHKADDECENDAPIKQVPDSTFPAAQLDIVPENLGRRRRRGGLPVAFIVRHHAHGHT
jgi:hypothetical protein